MASRTSTFLRGSGALLSPRNGQDSGRLPSVKSNYSVRKSSRQGSGLLRTPRANDWKGGVTGKRGSRRKPCDFFLPDQLNALSSIPTFETSTAPDSEAQLSLPGEFHASRHPSPGSEKERQMTVGSGWKLLESWPKSSQPGSFLKILLVSLALSEAWYSRICYLRWKARVTKSGRLLFQLVPSTPRTGGTGYGLLGTPASWDCQGSTGGGQGKSLRTDISRLNTPRTTPRSMSYLLATPAAHLRTQNPRQVDHGIQLANQIAMLPTPAARDYRGMFKENSKAYQARLDHLRGVNLVEELQRTNNGKNSGLKLQPAFVEWMMRFPIGWTDLKHSAMPSSRKSHTRSLRQSRRSKERD